MAEMIGAGCTANTVFVGRRPTGELCTLALRRQHPERDWILTRIIWLQGEESEVNQGGVVDTIVGTFTYTDLSPELGTP